MAVTIQQFADRFRTWPGQSQRSVLQSMREVRDRAFVLSQRAIAARSKTGRLRATLGTTGPTGAGDRYAVGLRAGSATVRYAGVQEFGGTIRHPGAFDKLQVFEVRGKTVFTMRTRPHTIRIPARPYMRPALQQAIKESHPARGYIRDFKRHVFGHA